MKLFCGAFSDLVNTKRLELWPSLLGECKSLLHGSMRRITERGGDCRRDEGERFVTEHAVCVFLYFVGYAVSVKNILKRKGRNKKEATAVLTLF